MPDPVSYCDRQIQAQRIVCATCQRAFYMTSARIDCFACRPATADEHAGVLDVSGSVIHRDP